jgi:hypothetical protein
MQMKHGDKAKGKASKASKTSDKKVGKAGGAKDKASESKGPGKSTEAKASSKAVEKSAAKAGGKAPGKGIAAKAGSARAPEGNGNRPRVETGDISFGNPLIAAAFKRAAKKYSNAFRRLTD